MNLSSKNPTPQPNSNNPTLFQEALVFIWEIVKVVIISLAIIIPVRYFLIQPFYVKGASMEPNFYDNEYLIIDEISYRFKEPARGDVVVFRNPRNHREFFIKRVIGLPGETIRVRDGEVLVINASHPQGLQLGEDYLSADAQTFPTSDREWAVKSGHYFLLGDNREHSLDSRVFGPVDQDLIVGSTLLRGWPLSRLGFVFEDVEYNF